jgi:hypothetical protein
VDNPAAVGGFLFDRFGPRRGVVGILILLATIGGIIFTRAPTWPVLLTGRVLTAPASASC